MGARLDQDRLSLVISPLEGCSTEIDWQEGRRRQAGRGLMVGATLGQATRVSGELGARLGQDKLSLVITGLEGGRTETDVLMKGF